MLLVQAQTPFHFCVTSCASFDYCIALKNLLWALKRGIKDVLVEVECWVWLSEASDYRHCDVQSAACWEWLMSGFQMDLSNVPQIGSGATKKRCEWWMMTDKTHKFSHQRPLIPGPWIPLQIGLFSASWSSEWEFSFNQIQTLELTIYIIVFIFLCLLVCGILIRVWGSKDKSVIPAAILTPNSK